MNDINSSWNVTGMNADWAIAPGMLRSGDELQTAVLISLFTDRLARADDSYEGDRRGWWGDSGSTDPMGSRLWLLDREVLSRDVALRAEEYALESLSWLRDENIVSDLGASAHIVWPSQLNLMITYQQPGMSRPVSMKFYWLWEQIRHAV
nr:phage GP46 family protein [Erwinia amylovora]